MDMICTQCGKESPETLRFCPYCGKNFSRAPEELSSSAPIQPEELPEKTKEADPPVFQAEAAAFSPVSPEERIREQRYLSDLPEDPLPEENEEGEDIPLTEDASMEEDTGEESVSGKGKKPGRSGKTRKIPDTRSEDPEGEIQRRKAARKEKTLGIFFLLGAILLVGMPTLFSFLFPVDYSWLGGISDVEMAALSSLRSAFSFLDGVYLLPMAVLSLAAPGVLLVRGQGGSRGVLLSGIAQILSGVYLLLMVPMSLLSPGLKILGRWLGASEEILVILPDVLWQPGANLGNHYLFLLPTGIFCLAVGISGLLLRRKGRKKGTGFSLGKLPRAVSSTVLGGALLGIFLALLTTLDQKMMVNQVSSQNLTDFAVVKSFWAVGSMGGIYRPSVLALLFIFTAICLLARKAGFFRLAVPGGVVVLAGALSLHCLGYMRYMDLVRLMIYSAEGIRRLSAFFWIEGIGFCLGALGLFLWAAASAKDKFPLWLQLPMLCVFFFGAIAWAEWMLTGWSPSSLLLPGLGILLIFASGLAGLFSREKKQKDRDGRQNRDSQELPGQMPPSLE